MSLWMLLALATQAPAFVRSPILWHEHPRRLMSRDLDGDGRKDFVGVFEHQLTIWLQRPGGSFAFDAPDQVIAASARAVCFELADLDGDGKTELVLLEDGARVVAYHLDEKRHFVRDREALISGFSAIMMDGLRHLKFVRDVDGDGKLDLIIPAPEAFLLFLQQKADGGKLAFRPGPSVTADVHINLEPGLGRSLGEHIGESVSVPFFELRDVNGDHRPDLISETGEVLACYLGGKDGLPLTPTFTLDLGALRRALSSGDEDATFDASNLLKNMNETVDHRAADVNGDGIEDHVVREGQRVSLYLGSPAGVDFTRADQVLKASGNVVADWVTDADDDGLLDLHILRVEDVSLAEVLLWLVKAGNLKFDLFIYRNEGGGAFAKRPTRHLTIDLEIPALLGFMDRVEDMAKDLMTRAQVPTTVADMTGAGKKADGLMLKGGKIAVSLGSAPRSWTESWGPREYWLAFLRRIGYSPSEDSYQISLDHVEQWIPLPGYELGQLLEGHPSSCEIELRSGDATPAIDWFYARDLNGDGKADLILLGPGTGPDDGGDFIGEVLVQR